ncbi:hypothetical protein L5515_017362 [Caenorhabditis briggsae]|uniref:Uncharacterized protein n=1 Tax=Caenorhabditis briggsae TaxID=6238 RepID=A0AAE9FGC3_CAEBR|nr:hypothetical protein L5515_017362 [Caenorhabditis briggsae]
MNRQTFGEYSTPDGPPELKRQRDPDSDLKESEDSEQSEHSKDDMSPQLQPELPDDPNRLLDKEDYDFGNALQNWMEDPDLELPNGRCCRCHFSNRNNRKCLWRRFFFVSVRDS